MSKDKSLWRVVDLTSKALGPTQARKAIKQYCNNKFTTSLSLRAINKRTHRKRVTVHKCEFFLRSEIVNCYTYAAQNEGNPLCMSQHCPMSARYLITIYGWPTSYCNSWFEVTVYLSHLFNQCLKSKKFLTLTVEI